MKKLESSYVKDLLNISLSKMDDFLLISPHLENKFVSDEDYRFIWRKIRIFHNKNNKLPTINYLIQDFSNKNKDEKYDRAIDLLIDLKESIIPESTLVLEGFEKFIKQNHFVEFYDALADLYNKEQQEQAYEAFIDKAKWFDDFSLQSTSFQRIFADWDKRNIERMMDNANRKEIQLPSGFDFIDETTEGGLWTGETELWLGDSGVGKTKLLTSRGMASATRGFNVLHVQIEGKEEQCTANYDANWTSYRYMDIKLGNISSERLSSRSKLAHKMIKNKYGDIYVRTSESFARKVTFGDVRRWLRELKRMGITIHHLIIDYLELMGLSNGNKYDYEGGERKVLDDLAKGFKDICMEFNVLGTTVAQSSNVKAELLNDPNFVMSRHNIGKHKRLIESFSYCLTINQTRIEKQKYIARVYEEKMREHPSGKVHKIKQSLKNSRFYDRRKTIEMLEEDEYEDE